VSNTHFLTLGAAIATVTSAYFCELAWREGHRALMWTMGLSAGAFFVGTLFFGMQLWVG
jgi:hypothetical protein